MVNRYPDIFHCLSTKCTRMKWLFTIALISILSISGFSQYRGDSIKIVLDELAEGDIPQLKDTIDISLTNVTVSDLLRVVSNHIGININVSKINDMTYNNYSKIITKDLLALICEEFDLEMKVYGSIISLTKIPTVKHKANITLLESGLINYDIKDASLEDFSRALSQVTGVNLFVPREFKNSKLSGFAQEISIDNALINLGASNNFVFVKTDERIFIVEPLIGNEGGVSSRRMGKSAEIEEMDGTFTLNIQDANLMDVISEAGYITGSNVSFTKEIDERKDVSLSFRFFEEFLNFVLVGTDYTYKFQDSVYYIGEKSKKELHSHFLYRFHNRRVDSLSESLPDELRKSLDFVEYPELNSLLVIGEISMLNYMKGICVQLDKEVPLILIDLILVQSSNSINISTGIKSGVTTDENRKSTTIDVLPSLDFTVNGESMNKILSSAGLSEFGVLNPNFYLQISALEDLGYLTINSTPKLSTLSGGEASLSIGETTYYEEKLISLYGTQNPNQQTQTVFKPIDAKLGITIKPVVMGNGAVNMEIEVIQSSFTDRIGTDNAGPPGIVAREFKSAIRVNDGETILLGGLETVMKEKKRTGIPWVSRIPILNWFFTSKENKNSEDEFSIFISPTIIY